MIKFFNTAGPVNPDKHYCLPLATRLNENNLRTLIKQEKYFILHAPRQTGKTSTILNFARQLNEEGIYNALYVNVESAQAARADYLKGMATILEQFFTRIKEQLPQEQHIIAYLTQLLQQKNFTGSSLNSALNEFSKSSSKPLIVFIDEIDSLIGDTLISVLRQIRSGYDQRPHGFPQSMCLIGVRDVRDYRIWSDSENQIILGGSAFNIKAKSIRMSDFTFEQVQQLYQQHTQLTGQIFYIDALSYAFKLTQGQPWLVNALANEACFEIEQDPEKPITKDIIEQAKDIIIKRRETHLDVLIDRLQEPRVNAIIDAIITGIDTPQNFPSDDLQYVIDLGLIAERDNHIVIANPIYQEVLPLELTYSVQFTLPQQQLWYVNSDGSIDMHKMLTAFTQFYRENSAVWLEKFAYKESGPHLLTMAFLQRIINGGGKINREYALGADRVDLLVAWKTQRIVIELKIWHSKTKTLIKGLEQTAGYMDTSNATEGHLVIFDKRDKSWDEKIYTKQEKDGNKIITIWGM